MHKSTRRQWLLLVVLALALLSAGPAAGRTPSAPPGPSGAVPSAENDVYLPLLMNPPAAGPPVEFALAVDDFGEPIDPTTTFQFGISEFYTTVRVRDQTGTIARVNYVRPNGRGGSVTTTIDTASERVTVRIRNTDGTPLETGTYTVEVLINEEPYTNGRATIQ